MARDIYSILEEYHERVVRFVRERQRVAEANDERYEAYERMAKVENDRIAQGGHEWLNL